MSEETSVTVLLKQKKDMLLTIEFYAMREHWIENSEKIPSCLIDKGSLARYTMEKYGDNDNYLITEEEYKLYLDKISKLMDKIILNKQEEKELDMLADRVVRYEKLMFPM